MIHRNLEGLLIVILSGIFVIMLPPFIIYMATDILPINNDLTVDQFIDTVVEYGNEYEYIEQSNYLFIQEFDGSHWCKHIAYRGKTSGYIEANAYIGSLDVIKVEGNIIDCYFSEYKGDYILEFLLFDKSLSLYDNKNNELDSISLDERRLYYKVLDDSQEDYQVYCKINDELFPVIGFAEIQKSAKHCTDRDLFDNLLFVGISGALSGVLICWITKAYNRFIINLYTKKISEAIYARDEEEKEALLGLVYKRQKGTVYNKICEEFGIRIDDEEN